MIERRRLVTPIAIAAVACWTASCGSDKKAEDTSTDDGAGDTADEDGADVTPDTAGDTAIDTAPEDSAEAPADVPVEDAVEEEVTTPPVCGNGTLEAGEVCDDGNIATEPCDTTTPGACLSDCSLDIVECGDGSADAGEACDDGDADTYDECTNSCTVNDHGLGAPCECTSGCSALDFTAGTIEGCSAAAALEDSSRTLACYYSVYDDTYSINVYSASGMCTLMAMGCEGTMCFLVPTTGDVDTFSCPAGFAESTDSRVQMGMTITTKTCYPLCDSQADCRWGDTEAAGSPWEGDCGQFQCLPEGDSGEGICIDARNVT